MFKPGFATVALAIINLSLGSYVAADPPRVVTDIALVHALVSRVMQGIAEVQLVIPIGALPHDYAMRPSEASALEGADLVVWLGEGLTPWFGGHLCK